MKYIIVLIAALLSVTNGFLIQNQRSNAVKLSMMSEKSKALPFLSKPAKLDGTVIGDFGFDPLGFTENIGNYDYVISSEIKHGRVAMLAVVGFIVTQYFQVVVPEANPFKAITTLGYGPNLQILAGIGAIELATWDKTFAGGNPGDFGFDPLGQLKGKSVAQINDLKLKEIKNGRLAMVAIIGIFVQYLTFGKPTLEIF